MTAVLDDLDRLESFALRHQRLFVLTGAGCSTESGIPDYRDRNGDWKRASPITVQAFTGDALARRRYWARSLVGWRAMGQARPGAAHQALADLENAGRVEMLLTQNVDGLHHAAGSRRVIDLHGRIDTVRCLQCQALSPRAELQQALMMRNPRFAALTATVAPDGDADLENLDFSQFDVPDCAVCGGMLKPDVVFFGENVPRDRVDAAFEALQASDAMLVLGSSLMVYSGLRFVKRAAEIGIPIAAVNLGRTRGDEHFEFKVDQPVGPTLAELARKFSA
ncbi:NAD-dependent protein deacetylase [Burkholderiales bacterium 8X]|nr:NAD-dependent protein deacetylase [Burkholderiales bacterium 8X]